MKGADWGETPLTTACRVHAAPRFICSPDRHHHSTKDEDVPAHARICLAFRLAQGGALTAYSAPEEADSKANSNTLQDAWEDLPERKEIGQPRWNVAAMADGGH
jgi:hypothetical protein